MKKILFIIIVFTYSCGLNKNAINDNSGDYLANKDTIIDYIDVNIRCGIENGNDSINIIIFNPDINETLKGIAIISISFDNVDSLKIKNTELQRLILRDSITNKTIFNSGYSKNTSTKVKQELDYYKSKIIPVITNYKFWIESNEPYNKSNILLRRVFSFPFTVKANAIKSQ